MEEVSGGIGSNFKSKVALQGWNAEAQALLLNSRIFSESKIVKCPNKEDLWNTESAEGFRNVSNDSSSDEMNFEFRTLIPLPPFLAKTFVDSGVTSPNELGFLAVASGKAFLE